MYRVRPMTADDIPHVERIELEAFPEMRAPTSYARELESKLSRYFVLEAGGTIVGYAAMWFIVDEAHLLSIAVAEDCRRQGLGELLLIAGMEMAMRREADMMTLEVRVSNLVAQALYEKYGFVKAGRRRGYYTDNNEDAFLMTIEHVPEESNVARLAELKVLHERRVGAYEIVRAD